MSSPARTSSPSSSLIPVTLGVAAALKIAQEACNDVPIARQILGSAVCIVELAQRFDKNKDSIRALADRSALLAQRIAEVVTGRALDDVLLQRLNNLKQVFIRIEAFMAKESAVSGRTQRIVRTLFVTPRLVEQLSADLQNEIEAFVLTAAVDLAHNNARYDGGFRVLRDADVCKLDVLLEVETPKEVVVYAKARVDNEIMVVTYTTPPRTRATSEETVRENAERSRTSRNLKRHDELLLKASTVFTSHPHVAQFYGRGISGSNGEFRVLRVGVHSAYAYMRQAFPNSPGRRVRTACEIHWKVTDATRYLQTELGIDWHPPTDASSRLDFTVNDEGEPMIGMREEFGDAQHGTSTDADAKYRYLGGFVMFSGRVTGRDFIDVDPREVTDTWVSMVSHWNDEALAAVSSLLATLTMTEAYHAKYRRIDLPLWDRPLEMSPDVLERTDTWYADELQLRDAECFGTAPPLSSAHSRCLAAVIQNSVFPDGSYWSWSCSRTSEGRLILRFDRAWTSRDGCRTLDNYDFHISPSDAEAFESAMGISLKLGTYNHTLRSTLEDILMEPGLVETAAAHWTTTTSIIRPRTRKRSKAQWASHNHTLRSTLEDILMVDRLAICQCT